MHIEDASTPRVPFDHFLAWFDYQRERASEEIAHFTPRIVSFFHRKGCGADSEDLAQDVFIRTARKFEERYVDREPKPYLFRVADFIFHEWLKKRKHVQMGEELDLPDPARSVERILADSSQVRFLRNIMDGALEPVNLTLLLRYIEADAAGRANLATERGVSPNALRVKIADLKKRVVAALRKSERIRRASSEGRSHL